MNNATNEDALGVQSFLRVMARRRRLIVVEGQLAHRIVPPIERPQSKTGSARRGGDQRVGDLQPVRARVT